MGGVDGQMSIFDFIQAPVPKTNKRTLGYITSELADCIRGASLRFRDLQKMTGQCVLVARRRQGAVDWAVYLVERFLVDYEDTWNYAGGEYTKGEKTDRCIMLDSYKRNSNSRLYFNEVYCTGGRFDGSSDYQSSIFEIKEYG